MQSDDELDFSSKDFDPNKALDSQNIKLPYEDAKTYDHLDYFRESVHSQQLKEPIDITEIPGVSRPILIS